MVDRESRGQLLMLLDGYLSGTIRAREFDEQLGNLNTKNKTVREIVFMCWFHYDDFIDHQAKLTRQTWNYFQRLRLIVQSDAEIKSNRVWNWTAFHLLTFISVALLLMVGWKCGMDLEFWAADLALGAALACVAYGQKKPKPPAALVPDAELIPFGSFSSMRAVYELTPAFQKRPYPRTMDLTPLHSSFFMRVVLIPRLFFWPMLALIGLLSIRRTDYSVALPSN
jgi:hypothetical protein